jgi:protein-L-isoaspartate O-methyltransferase
MVDVYHEFGKPYEMMAKMVAALKKGGRIVFVEYRAEDPAVQIKRVHKMSEVQVRKEMSVFSGMRWERTEKVLPQQHVIIFRKD